MSGAVFVDWFAASEFHSGGGLPVISGGVTVHYDASGVPRFERNCAATVPGSFATSVRVGCDGYRVSLSGNPGRFGRADNVFNHSFGGTVAAANRVLRLLGLPDFGVGDDVRIGGNAQAGARVSRLDVTGNFATGSDGQARVLIRWLAGRSVSRVKRGLAGDESVWWANTHHMFKAYRKDVEMVAHGADPKSRLVEWCRDHGVVRVEVELKKRLLSRIGANELRALSDERIEELFREHTAVLRSVDRSDDPDVLAAVPVRSRAYASAWLAGQDVRGLCSRATLFRHAKALRACGIDIMEPRSVGRFPVRVRTIELEPIAPPEWYEWELAA